MENVRSALQRSRCTKDKARCGEGLPFFFQEIVRPRLLPWSRLPDVAKTKFRPYYSLSLRLCLKKMRHKRLSLLDVWRGWRGYKLTRVTKQKVELRRCHSPQQYLRPACGPGSYPPRACSASRGGARGSLCALGRCAARARWPGARTPRPEPHSPRSSGAGRRRGARP